MSDAAPAGASVHQDGRSATDDDADDGPDDPDPVRGELRPHPQEVTRKPTTLSGVLAVIAAGIVAAVGGIYTAPALLFGGVGMAAIAVGVATGSRRAVDTGSGALLLEAVVAGTRADAAPMLVIAVAGVFAWDVANNAIDMGIQLGREADTVRAEVVHAGATLVAGGITAGFSYVVYVLAAGGQPVTALVLLLLAAVALMSALRL